MFCKQCANEIQGEARFCNKCGLAVADLVLPASMLKRFVNDFVDRITAFVIVFIFSFLVGISSGMSSTVVTILGMVLFFGYYLICETLWQRTLGKMITKTKVVDRNGDKPSFLKILGRSFARYIPFEALSFLFGSYPIGWHDSLSGTLVVPAEMTPEQVRAMDFEQIKKQKSHSPLATVLIIVAVLLVVVAIVGILASVVLASLNSARVKGADALVKSYSSSILGNGELYYFDNNNSYSGVCEDEKTLEFLTKASIGADLVKSTSNYVCNDSSENYAFSIKLRSDGYWCADNSLNQQNISAHLDDETFCPSLD